MKNSRIEWTDHTWNPWVGCAKVSDGCRNCYMFREMARFGRNPRVVERSSDRTFYAPLKWKGPARVFVCSWSDFFIPEAARWRDEAWNIIREAVQLTFMILTKRSWMIETCLPDDWGAGWNNVWLGLSLEDSDSVGKLKILKAIPARVRFVSYEPALGPLSIVRYRNDIKWVISGGESGLEAREAKVEWFRAIRDECQRYGIAYFHKQNGGNKKIDGSWGGRLLDGKIHGEFPE